MIEKIDITRPQSFKYLRDQLERGKALSACISKLAIEEGNIFSYVPVGTLEKQLFDFDNGGIYPFDSELRNKSSLIPIINNSKAIIIDEIQSHFNANPNNCCLFEDATSSPSDSWVSKSQIEYTHLDDNMFYFFDRNRMSVKKIEQAFTTSENYIFLCVLSTLNPIERSKFFPYKEITMELLELFVTNISSFFVMAYDHESYLMWQQSEK